MRTTLLALALLALPLTASAQGIIPDLVPYTSWELVGFTTTTTTGDMGALGATQMCHAEYPGARLCTSEEVIHTNALYLNGDEDPAWVHPSFSPMTSGSSTAQVLDASGVHDVVRRSTAKTRLVPPTPR
jgi:hypothetical protein